MSRPDIATLLQGFIDNVPTEDWWNHLYGSRPPNLTEQYLLRMAFLAGATVMNDLNRHIVLGELQKLEAL